MPEISVIIPVFNAAATVAETIESVLRQTFEDYEIIVVDDGSTDRTSQVLGRYQDRIQMVRRPNGGISTARNSGVGVSRGEYLAFLDGDDLWVPDFLSRKKRLRDRTGIPGPESRARWTDRSNFRNPARA